MQHENPVARFVAALWMLACLAQRPALAANADHSGAGPGSIAVGSVHLEACPPVAERYCTTLQRPLDPDGRVPGQIPVYVEFYPHRDGGPAQGTLVAIEGGPGYPTTDSRRTYLGLFDPLRTTRDVVLMDARGTGRSGAIRCAPLQDAPVISVAAVAACGRSLGASAPLYSAAYAADDLAAVLDALGAASIDLYGDSYGTFSAQVFARRHPERLRSLVLDGAYPLAAPGEAWAPSYAPAMREKFELACQRSPWCSGIPGGALGHLAPVLADLRRHPRTVRVPDADGHRVVVRADASALARVMFGGAPGLASVRELDAAVRAWSTGDRAPLLRLMAESLTATDSRDPAHDPAAFSAGQAVAVMCQDAEQIFDMTLPPAARRWQRDRVIGARQKEAADLYAPFTMGEYRGLPLDYAFLDECVDWPAPPAEHPPQHLYDPRAQPPAAPVLVLIGEMDNMTTPVNGAQVAAGFPQATAVTLRNSLHVNAKPAARSACGMQIVRRFIATLDPGDAACAPQVEPVRLVPRFARRAAELPPAEPREGNAADGMALRVAHAAVLALGDVLGRLETNATGRGPGLRGGGFSVLPLDAEGERLQVRIDALRFTTDTAVSGTLDWNGLLGANSASITVTGPGALHEALQITWQDTGQAVAWARIEGRAGKKVLAAEVPAP